MDTKRDSSGSNEFLAYSGKELGPQLRTLKETPSLFDVIIAHLMPSYARKPDLTK
jgi:hypothetical protein